LAYGPARRIIPLNGGKALEAGGAIMKIRRSIVAAGAAVILGGTGALVVPAIASAHSASHTLKFISTRVKTVAFAMPAAGFQDTDVNSAGKIIGFDEVNFEFTGATSGRGDVAIDVNGGFLYGKIATTNAAKTFKGSVTGGTGTFKGATGTITSKALNKPGTKQAITITYSG
jgi:hypothetical protein